MSTCEICGEKFRFLSQHCILNDAEICGDCMDLAGMSGMKYRVSLSYKCFEDIYRERKKLRSVFRGTSTGSEHILTDREHRLFMVDGNLFRFSELDDYDVLQDAEEKNYGGWGSAIAGAMLGGTKGFMLGSALGTKQRTICNDLRVRITLQNSFLDTLDIRLSSGRVDMDGNRYQEMLREGEKIISVLDNISEASEEDEDELFSPADEILKYKKLLDIGAITEAEYQKKKRELLDI